MDSSNNPVSWTHWIIKLNYPHKPVTSHSQVQNMGGIQVSINKLRTQFVGNRVSICWASDKKQRKIKSVVRHIVLLHNSTGNCRLHWSMATGSTGSIKRWNSYVDFSVCWYLDKHVLSCDNHRGISLLSIAGKIMARVVLNSTCWTMSSLRASAALGATEGR